MQTLRISKRSLLKSIDIPASKSYANRALILCSILEDSPYIHELPDATDVSNLLECLKAIGLSFHHKEQQIKFFNSFPACEKNEEVALSVGEGGTTARFLSVMLLLGKQKYILKLGKRLKDRPWGDFITTARSLGAFAELKDDLLTIQGPVTFSSELYIDCSQTTQFASAFQLILHEEKTKVIPTNLSSSQSYWEMTKEIQRNIKGLLHYHIPRDWSSASYPMVFAALNQEIHFPGLHYDKFQADAKLFHLLKSFECLSETDSGIVVKPIKSEKEVHLDVSDCLDLVPALAFFLAHIEGVHSLKGVTNLVFKESNRLDEIMKLLKIFKRNSNTKEGVLYIHGSKEKISSSLDLVLPDDHRMVMTGTLFLLQHFGGSVTPSESVKKSYPGFFDIISSETSF